MKRIALLLLLLASPAWGQSVTLPKTVEAKASRPIFVSPIVDGDDLAWEIDAGLDDWVRLLPPDVAKNFGTSKIFYADKGTYTIRAWTAKVVGGKAKLSDVATCAIVVDGGGPKPDPKPDPKPIPPPDPVIPSPFVGDGLRVLIVHDEATAAKLPREQFTAIYSQAFRDWLDAKVAKGPDGKTPERRFYDTKETGDLDSEPWRSIVKRPRPSLPWIIVGNSKAFYEGPLPASDPEIKALISKYEVR
jgi:hypothetical protein